MMQRTLGIALAAVAAVTGVALLVMGQLASTRDRHISGGTPTIRWDVVDIELSINWLLAIPVAVCLLAGLLIAVVSSRR